MCCASNCSAHLASIQGLQQKAAVGALPGCSLRIDCEPCVKAFHYGLKWATADRRKHARVHRLMLEAWDDLDPEEVVWMPAHTTASSVGVATLSNGAQLTELDRRGNAQADMLAKKAVEEHRVPEAILATLRQQHALAQQTVKWIGLASHLANNFEEAPYRDTSVTKTGTHMARKARAAAAAHRKANPTPKPALSRARPWALGGHALDSHPTAGWQCRICLQTSASWGNIAPGRCKGSAVAAWADAALTLQTTFGHIGRGHHRMLSGDTIWCLKCGAHGSKAKVVALRRPCTGTARANWVNGDIVPTAVGRSVNLRLLMSGKHPETRRPLPPAIPELQWCTAHQQAYRAANGNEHRSQPAADMLACIRLKEANNKLSQATHGQASTKRMADIDGAQVTPAPKRLKTLGAEVTPEAS